MRSFWQLVASALVSVAMTGSPVVAQVLDQGTVALPRSVILTLETDRMFEESDFGIRVAAEIEEEGIELAAENRKIEAELIAEESQLTDLRASTDAAAFTKLAEAFDEKVQTLRQQQNAKARALGTKSEETRQTFLNAAQPILLQIMQDANAAIIIERRNTIISLDAVDITDVAIDRINDTLGDGSDLTDKPAE